jgi:hypothetical protein
VGNQSLMDAVVAISAAAGLVVGVLIHLLYVSYRFGRIEQWLRSLSDDVKLLKQAAMRDSVAHH